MTLASTNLKDIYLADGTTRNWPITFPIDGLESTDIVIYETSDAGISTEVTTGYLVDLTVPQVTYPTEDTGLDPLVSGKGVVVMRRINLKQEFINVPTQGAIPLTAIESGFDRAFMAIQQLNEKIDRTPITDVSESAFGETAYLTMLAAAVDEAETAQAAAETAEINAETAQAAAETAEINAETAAASVVSGRVVYELIGSGTTLIAGVAGDIEMPACTLTGWTLLADAIGSLKIDIWKDTLANFPPTNADSITNGHEPELSSTTNATDTDITDWVGETLSAGDILRINVDSCTTITRASLILRYTRTIS